ncbi:MAG: hypothetical protein VW081_01995 [Nitrosopumilus sp.]|jgi:hypothetical protein
MGQVYLEATYAEIVESRQDLMKKISKKQSRDIMLQQTLATVVKVS